MNPDETLPCPMCDTPTPLKKDSTDGQYYYDCEMCDLGWTTDKADELTLRERKWKEIEGSGLDTKLENCKE